MKSASCCNECWFLQRKLSTLSNGEKHFHPVRQFPSQALLRIQHIEPVILHSSLHFVFEFFPSATLKVGSKSCILTVQEILHILGHLTETLLPAQSSASGQPAKEGFVFHLFQSQKKQRPTSCPERSRGTCGRSTMRRSPCWRGATRPAHPRPWTRQSSTCRSACQTCHSPCALMASNSPSHSSSPSLTSPQPPSPWSMCCPWLQPPAPTQTSCAPRLLEQLTQPTAL